ncbi:MAG: DUF4190 domain-containing protein [Planctomycetota bacterium]
MASSREPGSTQWWLHGANELSNENPYDYDDPFEEPDQPGEDLSDFSEPLDPDDSDQEDAFESLEPIPESAPPLVPSAGSPQTPQDGAPITATDVHCVVCGYNLTGVAIGGNCPECGTSVDVSLQSGPRGAAGPPAGMAITSMVLGICSLPLLCCCFVGPVLSIMGLIFGIIALKQLPDTPQAKGPRGMAIAGIICSSIGLLLGIAYMAFMFIPGMLGP